jgi:APA family basic amino acid/polyamine antiporter
VKQGQLLRRLGPFDATMIVMGGIVGSGIFINPHVVARQVHTSTLILAAWVLGGLIALLGAFVYAELAAIHPQSGGQYAYLRDGLHPALAFLYGWALLLVIQSGGMAAVAITFARYAGEITGTVAPEGLVASITLAGLAFINCLGVRSGSNAQSTLMLLKIAAITALLAAGFFLVRQSHLRFDGLDRPASLDLLISFGAAMTPVMFAYGGWQTASFISAELRRPQRDLALGLIAGVIGVIILYVSVNAVCLRVLGPDGLAATPAPASAVMRQALGDHGAEFIALGIAISTLGFLSQGILTAPRVYLAMAQDGVFFQTVAWIHPRTQVPVVAILLQAVVAVIIAVSGTYGQILNYVVSVDFVFFGLTGVALMIFRRRRSPDAFRMPGHPVTTVLFIAACWAIVVTTVWQYPVNSAIGFAILLSGIPVYGLWRRRARRAAAAPAS